MFMSVARASEPHAAQAAETSETQELRELGLTPEEANEVVFEGSAEDAIRLLEGEHAEETIQELRREGLLCGSST
jgi:hypothetical protein